MDQPSWPLPVSVKEEVGVVFSDSGFPGTMTPADVADVLAAFYPGFDRTYYQRLLQQMELPEKKAIQTFSSGMQVRMKLVAAIVHHPKLLILDEPTAGLDVLARRKIHELLQDFMDEGGKQIVISSHIASDLESLCDDFWMIHNGSIILHETVDALLHSYGILKLSEKEFAALDPTAAIAYLKDAGGYQVLVSDRQFYEENMPQAVMEKGSLDDLILILEEGEKL